ncbi:MAG: SUMF1/EgtB/PvdO family nonheme iron enzyme [Treponema sp.]|jgi:formylglycine-generating enzyme required for sulfatase activity|nr:SUMF1/EgtB/PvdO family nonheme iron enzyme [Treponema sp.]
MKTKHTVLLYTLSFLFVLPAPVCAQESVSAPQKFALVIGNAAYTQVSPLRNTLNDAADVMAALEGLGFEAELLTDGTLRQMAAAVDRFARRLGAAADSYGFFYYSGHGVQSQGENFLIPVDADIRREADLAYEALHVQRALDYLQEAGNRLNVVVLDACRDNPFSWARSGGRGLTVTSRQPPGSIVVYATSAGSTASDISEGGTGRNGLFTAELLKHLKTPGLEVKEVFNRTGADVSRASGSRQIPAVYSQFFGTAYLGKAPQAVSEPQAAPYTPPAPQFGPIAAAVGNLEVAAATAGTLNIRGGGLDRDVPFTVGGTLPISGLQTGTYRLTMNYRDGKTEEKTVDVEAGQTAKASFNYRIPPATAPAVASALYPPGNIKAGTPGYDSIPLSWDSAGSGIKYRVYYGTVNDPSKAKLYDIILDRTNAVIPRLEGNQTYYFWISSLDGVESVKSGAVSARTRPVPDEFVRIPSGSFLMGSPASEAGRWDGEGPQHSVTVGGFFISKYEVTQKEWKAVMRSNPSYFKGDDLPVENVSWYDAIEYCNKRSVKEGLTPAYTRNGDSVMWNRNANGYRLPTEAEWEYACRAGTAGPFSTGNNITTGQANYNGNYPYNENVQGEYREKTWNVGSGAANAWGLYDMHGNVWEWCWDRYGSYDGKAQTDPAGPSDPASSDADRVERGGGWSAYAQYLRSANRNYYTPSGRVGNLGFRLVRP